MNASRKSFRSPSVNSRVVLAAVPLAVALAFSSLAQQRDPAHYRQIVDRNLFDLKEPLAQPVSTVIPPKVEDTQYKLTGIAVISETTKAMVMKEIRGTPPRHLTFTAGERQDNLEAVWIDKDRGAVLLRDGDEQILLSFGAQVRERIQAEQDEREFNEGHTRAHEEYEAREREREQRELEAAQETQAESPKE